MCQTKISFYLRRCTTVHCRNMLVPYNPYTNAVGIIHPYTHTSQLNFKLNSPPHILPTFPHVSIDSQNFLPFKICKLLLGNATRVVWYLPIFSRQNYCSWDRIHNHIFVCVSNFPYRRDRWGRLILKFSPVPYITKPGR